MVVKLLRIFAQAWATLVTILILISLSFIWYSEGFAKVQEIMSPFNIINFIVTIISLSPAIGAWALADHLVKKDGVKR